MRKSGMLIIALVMVLPFGCSRDSDDQSANSVQWVGAIPLEPNARTDKNVKFYTKAYSDVNSYLSEMGFALQDSNRSEKWEESFFYGSFDAVDGFYIHSRLPLAEPLPAGLFVAASWNKQVNPPKAKIAKLNALVAKIKMWWKNYQQEFQK